MSIEAVKHNIKAGDVVTGKVSTYAYSVMEVEADFIRVEPVSKDTDAWRWIKRVHPNGYWLHVNEVNQ